MSKCYNRIDKYWNNHHISFQSILEDPYLTIFIIWKLNTDINLEFLVFLWIISFPCIRHDISSNSFWEFKKRNKTVSGKFYIHNKGRNRNFSNWMTRRNDMMISKSIFWSRVPMTKDLHSKGINNIIEYFLIWTLLTCIKQLKTNLWIVNILYYLQKNV